MSGIQQSMLAGTGPKVLTYRANTFDLSDLATYTFSGMTIGNATGDRRVHAAFFASGGSGSPTIVSATVGGVAAVINKQATNSTTTTCLLTALVPTGTTADIVVTVSSVMGRATIGVWSSTGLMSDAAVDAVADGINPSNPTLTSVPGGFCIGSLGADSGSSTTWTTITEQYDTFAGAQSYSGASGVTPSTTFSPRGSLDGTGSFFIYLFATW